MTDINITDEATIEEVQTAFHEHFPYLKLEFYKQEHEEGKGSSNKDKIDVSTTIGDARSESSVGNVSIHGNQKVSTLERVFRDVYGLNVQVFRKSGGLWLQTTTTDDWTLSEQNDTAKEFALR